MNRFDLTALLKIMKILVSDNNIKTGNYTEIYLKNKFLSSFILSFQKTPPEKSLEDNMSRRITASVNPARRATPRQLSKPTKPSSLQRPVGVPKLSTKNSWWKQVLLSGLATGFPRDQKTNFQTFLNHGQLLQYSKFKCVWAVFPHHVRS